MAELARIGRGVLGVFYLAPWAWLLVFGVLLAATIVQYGHVPSYADPDPKHVTGFRPVLMAAYLLIIPLFLSPLAIGLEVLVATLRKASLRARAPALAIYALGFCLSLAVMFADAARLINWLMD